MGSVYFRVIPVGKRTGKISHRDRRLFHQVDRSRAYRHYNGTKSTELPMETSHLPPRTTPQRGNRQRQAIH